MSVNCSINQYYYYNLKDKYPVGMFINIKTIEARLSTDHDVSPWSLFLLTGSKIIKHKPMSASAKYANKTSPLFQLIVA